RALPPCGALYIEHEIRGASAKRRAVGLAAVIVGGALGFLGCDPLRSPPAALPAARSTSSPAVLLWPDPAAPLTAPALAFPPDFGSRRIFVDAGHGAPDNPGNSSTYCVDEQDFTLRAARDLAGRLAATGHFEVRLS